MFSNTNLKLILTILVFLFSSLSFAADPIVHQIESEKYLCFDEPSANKNYKQLLDYPKLELKLETQGKLLLNLEQQIVEFNAALDNLNEQKSVLIKSNVTLQEKLNSAYAWYRSPTLWFAIGSVVACGTTLLIFELAK